MQTFLPSSGIHLSCGKDSCGIGTDQVEIQPTIDLVEYDGFWPACGGGKSGGY